MEKDELYGLLQNVTSPVVAVTSSHDQVLNGMIANSAIRASLVPECPRVAFYCFKNNYSHELISGSGSFCLHLLHRDQFNVIGALGFESGRNTDKLDDLDFSRSTRGLPILGDVYGFFECKVVNAMDAGPSTFFMGEVQASGRHPDHRNLKLMDSDYFRRNMPEGWKEDYRANKQAAQEWARDHLEVDPNYSWNG